MLETGSPRCSSLALHGSLPLLVAASARQEVSVWDWQRKQRLNAFANGNCAGSRISAMLLLPFTKPREVRWLNNACTGPRGHRVPLHLCVFSSSNLDR